MSSLKLFHITNLLSERIVLIPLVGNPAAIAAATGVFTVYRCLHIEKFNLLPGTRGSKVRLYDSIEFQPIIIRFSLP